MDDGTDLTPWEDINPPMGLAQRRERPSECSAQAEARTVFRNELTACLALTAPVGMTEEARGEWLAVAWETLKDIPPDILMIGANAARQNCDHPSKIVPTIFAATKDMMGWHRGTVREAEPVKAIAPPNFCTPEEAAAILEEVGLKSRFASQRQNEV